jgi:hypothetical protein
VQIGGVVGLAAEIGDRVDRRRTHGRTMRAQRDHNLHAGRPVDADPAADLLVGQDHPKAKFEFMRADGKGERIKYFEIELENVLIGDVSPAVGEGDILTENMGLKFSKVKWKYTQQKVTGGSGGNTSGGWDLATNKVV